MSTIMELVEELVKAERDLAYAESAFDRLGKRDRQKEVEEARAALTAELASGGWRPIATVPRDGREVILREGGRVGAACWTKWSEQRGPNGEVCEDAGEGWTAGYDGDLWMSPTHWQPMPAADVPAVPAGYALVPLEPTEALCGQLCGYGADLGYMDERDRGVILERGHARWAEILGWAGTASVGGKS